MDKFMGQEVSWAYSAGRSTAYAAVKFRDFTLVVSIPWMVSQSWGASQLRISGEDLTFPNPFWQSTPDEPAQGWPSLKPAFNLLDSVVEELGGHDESTYDEEDDEDDAER